MASGFMCFFAGSVPSCSSCHVAPELQDAPGAEVATPDEFGTLSREEDVKRNTDATDAAGLPIRQSSETGSPLPILPPGPDEAAGPSRPHSNASKSTSGRSSVSIQVPAQTPAHRPLSNTSCKSQASLESSGGSADMQGDPNADSFQSTVPITFDEEFDMYEPSTKEMKILKIADVSRNVLHQRDVTSFLMKRFLRRKSVDENTNKVGGQNPEDDYQGSGSSGDSEDSDSSGSEGSDSEGGTTDWSPKPVLLRAPSSFDADNVTNWAMLIAKLIRRRVVGITGIALKTMLKKRRTLEDHTATAQYVLPSVRARAEFVVEQARSLAKSVAHEATDRFDSMWKDESTISYLFGDDYNDTFTLLANTARKVFAAQPVLAEVVAPCRVFGDIHGQLRDLLVLFRAFGFPNDRGPSFIFNGDFVDRGRHSLHVVGLLFALKILMPEQVWLIRGNHEDRAMNQKYGFEDECYKTLGAEHGPMIFELIHRAFDQLPLAGLIAGKALVVHGGIGEGRWSLDELRAVERPLREQALSSDPMIWNILWSDPIEDDKADSKGVFGVHVSPRSATGLYRFGWNVTKTFCAANGLSLIIRSHQSKAESLGFSVMHDKMLVRIFSARDYEEHGNDGAVLLVNCKDPGRPRGGLVIRPQVVRSLTKQHLQDPNARPAKKGKRRRPRGIRRIKQISEAT